MGWIWPAINWICLAICFVFAVYIMKRESSNIQKYLMLSFVCGFAAGVCNMVELYATCVEVALTAAKIAYMGKLFMVLFALVFAVEFAQIKFSEIPCYILGIIDTIFLLLIMTNEQHYWFYRNVHMIEKSNGMLYMVTDKGPLYYIIMGEIAVCIVVAVMVVIKGTKGKSTESKGRAVAILALAVLGVVFFAAWLCYILETIDPATLVITVLEIMLMISIKNYGLLDSKQIVQESALESTQEGLILVDEKKRLIYANAVARKLCDEITDDCGQITLEHFFREKEWVLDKDGYHYEARVSEVRNSKGDAIQGYIVWFFDMTFLNQYTNEMIRHKEEAVNADRAKTNFLAHISHELRTPMNAIVGYSELATKEQMTQQGISYLTNIKSAAKMLIGMMNEILDITKIESGKVEITEVRYNLDKMIQEMRSMMESQAAKKKLEFRLWVDCRLPKNLIGDRGKVYEVIMNLLSNAIKYTREGSISLQLKQLETTKSQVLLQIEVEDTGIGIKKEHLNKVFDKFMQFDREKNYDIQGSGLGLAITRHYVEMMEGEIQVESEYEKGTRFTVTLWQGITDSMEEEIIETDTTVELRRVKVLVVDDNEMNCDVAKGLLKHMGVETDIALSGEECLALLEKENDYALILSDHMMPGMDGVELLQRIRLLGGRYENIPVIVQTANAISGVQEQMLQIGFDDFIAKPIQMSELYQVLAKYIGVSKDI